MQCCRHDASCPVLLCTLQTVTAPPLGFPLLLPPLLSPTSPTRSCSGAPSPYLDVSTAISIFNSSSSSSPSHHSRSPLGRQQRRSANTGLTSSQQHLSSPSSQSQPLRCSWSGGSPTEQRTASADPGALGAGSTGREAKGSNGIQRRWTVGASAADLLLEADAAQGGPASATAEGLSTAATVMDADTHRVKLPSRMAARSAGGLHSGSSSQPQRRRLPAGWLNTRTSSRGCCKAAGLSRARRRQLTWDDNTNPPTEPSFEHALTAWQEDMEEGKYGAWSVWFVLFFMLSRCKRVCAILQSKAASQVKHRAALCSS